MIPLLAEIALDHRQVRIVRFLACAIDRDSTRLKDTGRCEVIEAPKVVLLIDLWEALVLSKCVNPDD